jgi:hypothetical protein
MTRQRIFSSSVCAVGGLYYTTFGVWLFFSPYTFWSRIAAIGPFNAHYARDVGSFLLPLGILLLVAALDPLRFQMVIMLAALGSALHAVSHFLDGLNSSRDLFSDVSLALIALLLFAILPWRKIGQTT